MQTLLLLAQTTTPFSVTEWLDRITATWNATKTVVFPLIVFLTLFHLAKWVMKRILPDREEQKRQARMVAWFDRIEAKDRRQAFDQFNRETRMHDANRRDWNKPYHRRARNEESPF